MAWEATHLLPLVLLVLLASGSWEQQPQTLWKREGEEVSVRCEYQPQRGSKTKIWCRITPAGNCDILVTSPRPRGQPGNQRYVIMDNPQWGHFNVTMTALREDSGLYWCGTLESPGITILRTIRLVVSPGVPPAPALPEQRLLAIVLTCGFILNKGLVFSVLFVLLWKDRASGEPDPGEQQSHPSRS